MRISAIPRAAMVVACLLVSAALATAQDEHHFNFSAGAGFSKPTSDASKNFNTGWNLDFRGGYNVSSHFLADLDFAFNRWNLTSAALAKAGQPGGYADIWSIDFEPMIRVAPHSRVDPYLMAGTGLYHRNLNFTKPSTFTTIYCDPFFGYCYPAAVSGNVVVATFSTYKMGYNMGGGLEFRLGSGALKGFAEARYENMFTTFGPDLRYVPVTFGIRW